MYGWFEPGSSINRFFYNTKMIDVLLRTSTMSNVLVFGNTDPGGVPNAGMYISQNSVGIQKVPDTQYSLDISGRTRAEVSFECGDVLIRNNSITMGDNKLLLTNQGSVQANLVIADRVMKRLTTVSLVVSFCTIDINNNIVLSFESDQVLKTIVPGMVLQIEDINYSVGSVPMTNTVILSPFFSSLVFSNPPFVQYQILSVEVMQDAGQQTNNSRVATYFTINSYTFPNPDTWAGTVTFDSRADLAIGRYYSFGLNVSIHNIVQLVSFTQSQDVSVDVIGDMVLKTLDGQAFPDTWNTSTISGIDTVNNIYNLMLLDALTPPTFQDDNASIGTYTSSDSGGNAALPYVMLKNMGISRYLNKMMYSGTNPVATIVFNQSLQYQLVRSFINPEGLSVGQLSSTTEGTFAFTVKGVASYNLIATPLVVTSVSTLLRADGLTTFLHTVNDLCNILPILKSKFVGNQLYICFQNGTVCDIISVNVSASQIVLNTNICYRGIADPNYIFYVQPYRLNDIVTNLGNICYASDSLSIGTNIVGEKLTVAGGASVVGKLLINDALNATPIVPPFPLLFKGNKFTMGRALCSTLTQVTLLQNTTVNGTIVANDFLKYSDRRIKKNINVSSGLKDYELIKRIQIKDFKFKELTGAQKGIIAQELEMLIPDAVKEKKGFMPSVCRIGYTTSYGSIVICGGDLDFELDVGCRLQIKIGSKTRIVRVTHTRQKKNSMFIGISEQYPVGTQIYVRGPYGRVKVVNKDYLLMTLFNATKYLVAKVEEGR